MKFVRAWNRSLGLALLFYGALIYPSVSLAIKAPLKKASDLPKPVATETIRVKTSQVVVADYDLIRRDFPELRKAKETEIDQWLIKYTSFVSRTQKTLGGRRHVNRKIETDKEVVTAYRPKLYGRALVFKAGSGLIDVKGCGAVDPWLGKDSNGLLDLEEAVEEFGIEKLVHSVFKHSGSTYDTIETYAVISLGFDEKSESKGGWYPAGLILRQAHARTTDNWTCFDTKTSLKIENLLRSYGITSVGNLKHINIQGTKANGVDGDAVVDFSSYSREQEFTDPLKDFDPYWKKQKILSSPSSDDFVQPNPYLMVKSDFFSPKVFLNSWLEKFNEGSYEGHFPSAFNEHIQGRLNEQWKAWPQDDEELEPESRSVGSTQDDSKSSAMDTSP